MKFVLNDETKVNQYGFKVLNAGLDLERFKKNPVILDYHYPNNFGVIGRWEDIQIEGHLLTAKPVFDEEDEHSRRIAGKVKRGFLRGASLGLNPYSLDNIQLNAATQEYELVKSEVLEASIVAIPNNANAIKLYATSEQGMQELEDSKAQQILLMATEIRNYKSKSMKTIKLSATAAMALALNADKEHDVSVVNEGIMKLKAERDEAKQKLDELEQIEKDMKAKLAGDLVDQAIKEGKITAPEREDYIKLYASNPDLCKSVLDKLPGKTNLAGKIGNPGTAGNFADVKSLDDFEKLNLNAQIEFKTNYPEQYKSLFN